ncbi:MAG: hypothetical protein IH585_15450 [Anaerolineaceae bacterium]|nr:hypothetical protein [Anaerolineaceae bacterium]
MESFHEAMMEYKQQMQLGVIPRAYRGIMDYMLGLKAYLQAEYPAYNVSGSMYFGYMDMSYFSFFSDSLQTRKLKTGIVFIHESCQFEAWLFGVNKQVQKLYWQLIKDNGWNQYPLVATTRGEDAILTHVLIEDPNFDDLDALTNQIEKGAVKFIQDVEDFFSGQ